MSSGVGALSVAFSLGLGACGGSTHTTSSAPALSRATAPGHTTAAHRSRAGPPSCIATGYADSSCRATDGLVLELARGHGTLRLPGLRARVLNVTRSPSTSHGRFTATAKGEFVIITLQVTNTTGTPQTFSGLGTQTSLLIGPAPYNESFNAENGTLAGTFIDPTAVPIQPGKTQIGKLIYDVPASAASTITANPSAGVVVGKFGDDLSQAQTLDSPLGFILLKGA